MQSPCTFNSESFLPHEICNTALPLSSPTQGNLPTSAPTALVFSIGQSALRRGPALLRPSTTNNPSNIFTTCGSNARAGFEQFSFYSSNCNSEGKTDVDKKLAALKEKRRIKSEAFDRPSCFQSPQNSPLPVSQSANVTMPAIGGITRSPVAPRLGTANNSEYISGETNGEPVVGDSNRKPVSVSAATLKRRKAAEKKEKEKTEPTQSEVAGSGLREKKAGTIPPWQRHKPSQASLETTTQPILPVADRCRRLEEIILLLQGRGPQAAAIVESAVQAESGGKRGGKISGKSDEGIFSAKGSFEWMCFEKGLQELRSEVLDRWLGQANQDRIVSAVRKLCSPQEVSVETQTPSKRKLTQLGSFPSQSSLVAAQSLFVSNTLFKLFRDTILLKSDEIGEKRNSTIMYVPSDKEIKYLLNNVGHIVKACLICSENGRSSVCRLGVETAGALCEALGVLRLRGYYCGDSSTKDQYIALINSPVSRALDNHADSLLTKFINKGGAAGAKFLYDVSSVSLLQILSSVTGSGNKILIGSLLQSIGNNVPKTEKSRVLWADSLSFSLIHRWSFSFLVPVLNVHDKMLSRTLPTLELIVSAILLARTDQCPSEIANQFAKLSSEYPPVDGAIGPLYNFPIPITHKDMKEILSRAVTAIDVLLADGSPDVRDAGKRVLLALVLLLEEHGSVNASLSGPIQTLPLVKDSREGKNSGWLCPPGGLANALVSQTTGVSSARHADIFNFGGKDSVPQLETYIARTFADAKVRFDRMREALNWARVVYVEGLAPLILSFNLSTSLKATAPQTECPSHRSQPSTKQVPVSDSRDVSFSNASTTDSRGFLKTPHIAQPQIKCESTCGVTTDVIKIQQPHDAKLSIPHTSDLERHLQGNIVRIGRDAPSTLLAQLQVYIEGSGCSVSRGLSRGHTPNSPQSFSASPPSKGDILGLRLSEASQNSVREWSEKEGLDVVLATCVAVLRSGDVGSCIRDKDRESALKYLLYHQSDPCVCLPYSVGSALMDGILTKVAHANHRIHGMCLQLLLLIVRTLTGHAEKVNLHFSVSKDSVDAVCGKSVGFLTTAMSSSSGVISMAATEVISGLYRIVCDMLSEGTCHVSGKSGAAINSIKSLLDNLMSTCFATKNPTARTSLFTVARGSIIEKTSHRITVSDVRFLVETTSAVIASEVSELASFLVRHSAGLENTLVARTKTPSMVASVCAAAMRLLLSVAKKNNQKLKDLIKKSWDENVAHAFSQYLTLAKSVASECTSTAQLACSDESPYEDDFEGDEGEGEGDRLKMTNRSSTKHEASSVTEARKGLRDFIEEITSIWEDSNGGRSKPNSKVDLSKIEKGSDSDIMYAERLLWALLGFS